MLSFKNGANRKVNTGYYQQKVQIKDENAINDGRNFFDRFVKNYIINRQTIEKIATGERDGFKSCCFIDYGKLIVIEIY